MVIVFKLPIRLLFWIWFDEEVDTLLDLLLQILSHTHFAYIIDDWFTKLVLDCIPWLCECIKWVLECNSLFKVGRFGFLCWWAVPIETLMCCITLIQVLKSFQLLQTLHWSVTFLMVNIEVNCVFNPPSWYLKFIGGGCEYEFIIGSWILWGWDLDGALAQLVTLLITHSQLFNLSSVCF